ncbi:MAG: hypothetical protein V3T72_12155 [Thermoanaerobaculia bacterium]
MTLRAAILLFLLAPVFAGELFADELALVINDRLPLVSATPEVMIAGRSNAPPGSTVSVVVRKTETTEASTAETRVEDDGRWTLTWTAENGGGLYTVEATVEDPQRRRATATAELRIQPRGRLPRRPLLTAPTAYALPVEPERQDFLEFTDRWRIPLPDYELSSRSRRWDPYNQNVLKGDFPIRGQDRFLVLTATSDTLVDAFQVPTPSSVSADRPGSIDFFGEGDQVLVQQNLFFSVDYYKGSTAFKPFDWRWRATVAVNGNYLDVRETAAVSPDVRRGTDRTDGRLALQELFYEYKIADLSANYDFLSLRFGIQPFNSDFRGFVFTDTNLGIRLFGNYHSNRTQYNLAVFERLEKDTNSGLNTFELRDQLVVVANLYRQDFLVPGYTAQWSLHYLRDDPTFLLDKNGFLARPDPVGSATPHEVEALYLGWAGFGHFGRWNVDHALYYAVGKDSLNPVAGADVFAGRDGVDIGAFMAALELSIDRDWMRPKLAFLWSSGDDDPVDRDAEGFAAIFENPNFAGGGFSFWNRLGIRLAGTGASLVNRGSLIPDLRTSKEEGQPNFVNPGLQLVSLGLDVEVTPEIKTVFTVNYLQFDTTEVLELLTFQRQVDREIGVDLSAGLRWRPFLNNNMIVLGGIGALLPGSGFRDIYEDGGTLLSVFTNLTLTF